MLNLSKKSWWETDSYTRPEPIPAELLSHEGPEGIPVVSVNSNGSTQKGWGIEGPNGEPGFMPRYLAGQFDTRRKLAMFQSKDAPFAFVMRGLNLVCVDIDGKNGGLEHASRLGPLPRTLAETSKSGNGYHLFYYTEDPWDHVTGFGEVPDQIGIVQGVDIRGLGCVYHYHTQRWNNTPIAPLPEWLRERLLERKKRRDSARVAAQKINTLDELEKAMAHEELIEELQQAIPAGRRNTTLFAIGSKLMQAGYDKWDKAVIDRGHQLGMASLELDKIVENVNKYGASA